MRGTATDWDLDGSPAWLRNACEASLRALGVEAIDLYQLHRPDPDTPYAESVGALRDLRDEGKIRHVGLSNANLAQLEEAERIVPIAAIQNELSPRYLTPLRTARSQACAERGIAVPGLVAARRDGRGGRYRGQCHRRGSRPRAACRRSR